MNGARKPHFETSSFSLPVDLDSDRYELWTLRLPWLVDLQDLDGKTIDCSRQLSTITFQSKKQSFSLQKGNAAETSSFRVLLQKRHNDDDSDSVDSDNHDNANNELLPCTVPFKQHFTVTALMRPHEELATTITKPKVDVRRAYAHVPQQSGMKRRWKPIGGDSMMIHTLSEACDGEGALVKRKQSVGDEAVMTGDKKNYKSDSTKGRQDKNGVDVVEQSAKKARKEAKKIKKEQKKAKKGNQRASSS